MKIFTVSELTHAIKALLEPQFRAISLQGEISNLKLQSSGHLYFSLKDASSQISAVLFRGNAASLAKMPKDGDQVLVKAELSLYAPRGQYQIVIKEMQFLGMGELLLKLHQLKEVLGGRGWFDAAKKKLLPKFPKTIGVITSPTGAVIQDILHVLTRRAGHVRVLLNPVKVQGEGAAQEIAQAIEEMNRYQLADLLIVGRGGGSIEDLWAFNEEIVAKAIFESKIPIISAVGHETDFTIADFVADVRAPTPSAAAEIAVAERAALLGFLSQTRRDLDQKIATSIKRGRERLGALQKHPLLSSPYGILSKAIQQIDGAKSDLNAAMQRKLEKEKSLLDSAKRRFAMVNFKTQIAQKRSRLQALSQHLHSLNPQNLLRKGYAILFKKGTSSVIMSAQELVSQPSFTALLHDGRVAATAQSVDP